MIAALSALRVAERLRISEEVLRTIVVVFFLSAVIFSVMYLWREWRAGRVHDWRYRPKCRFLRDTVADPPFSSGPNYTGLTQKSNWDHGAKYVHRGDAEWVHFYDRWVVALLCWRKKRREKRPPYLS